MTRLIWFVLAWALLLAGWEAASWAGWLNPQILPPPSETLPFALSGEVQVGFGQQRIGLTDAVAVTLLRVSLGMALGLLASLVIAILVTELALLRRIVLPIVQSLAPIAPVAWIPFTIVVVGIGGPAAVFIVFMAVTGSLSLSLISALDHTPQEFITIARNLRTPPLRLWWQVRLPAIIAPAITSVRMAFFGAWMAVLAGEMAGINSGLGYMIVMAQQMYNMKIVMIGIITIGLIGFSVDRLLLLLNHFVLEKLYGSTQHSRAAA